MSLMEFFGMFKRFSVMLTWQDLPLNDREYRVTNGIEKSRVCITCVETAKVASYEF